MPIRSICSNRSSSKWCNKNWLKNDVEYLIIRKKLLAFIIFKITKNSFKYKIKIYLIYFFNKFNKFLDFTFFNSSNFKDKKGKIHFDYLFFLFGRFVNHFKQISIFLQYLADIL